MRWRDTQQYKNGKFGECTQCHATVIVVPDGFGSWSSGKKGEQLSGQALQIPCPGTILPESERTIAELLAVFRRGRERRSPEELDALIEKVQEA